ncbi:hypothetical protein [Azotobacter salinestris]|uniref:hypothetical protein n=1 Tax=Azotobacter salinestris TaxID=69964 RepID=UPI0032DEBC45
MPGYNVATLGPSTPEEAAAVNAKRQECLERYKAALELACQIHAQRRDKGKGWRMWAERELAARPELEREARAKLNRLMKGQASE